MPPPQFIKPAAHGKFASAALKMPTQADWKQPLGKNVGQYIRALGLALHIPAIDSGIPIFRFQNPTNMYHHDSKAKIGDIWRKFMDAALDAIQYAALQWKLQAKFQNLIINAVTAMGSPGCLDGPELESFIKNAPSLASYKSLQIASKHVDAVAAGVSKCFKNWQGKVTVPGLPWYPAFAAFPGPMAPPMPNVPVPLVACISAQCTEIMTPTSMKSEMVSALDGGVKNKCKDKQYDAAYDGIATAAALGLTTWLPQQQVMLIMGKGPIPSFAPPYVPVGPVVAGDNISAPGHAMT